MFVSSGRNRRLKLSRRVQVEIVGHTRHCKRTHRKGRVVVRPLSRQILNFKLALCFMTVAYLTGCIAGENARVEHANVCIDLSSDGKTVVFSSADGDLYLFDVTTKRAERLTATDRIESCPSFSPDDRTVVFAASKNEKSPAGIFLINL